MAQLQPVRLKKKSARNLLESLLSFYGFCSFGSSLFLCWKKRWRMGVEQSFCDHEEENHVLWRAEQKDKIARDTEGRGNYCASPGWPTAGLLVM